MNKEQFKQFFTHTKGLFYILDCSNCGKILGKSNSPQWIETKNLCVDCVLLPSKEEGEDFECSASKERFIVSSPSNFEKESIQYNVFHSWHLNVTLSQNAEISDNQEECNKTILQGEQKSMSEKKGKSDKAGGSII
jgi:hypothetical protein